MIKKVKPVDFSSGFFYVPLSIAIRNIKMWEFVYKLNAIQHTI